MKSLIITFFVLFLLWVAYGFFSVWQIEMPSYQVLQKEGAFEIRQYDSFLIAEATVEVGDYWTGLNQGFSVVADYIFGNNQSQNKIAMTSPVVSESVAGDDSSQASEKIAMTTPVVSEMDGDKMKLYFVMPSEFSLETIPRPNDSRVSIRQIPSQKRLALRFSWWASSPRIERKIEAFKAYAKANDIKIDSIQIAQYNPPGTPPFMRRNEIWATIQ